MDLEQSAETRHLSGLGIALSWSYSRPVPTSSAYGHGIANIFGVSPAEAVLR
jgi:hypothetical protein